MKQEYNLKTDHKNIKKQIKEWETEIDICIVALEKVATETEIEDIKKVLDTLEGLSDEMMAVNV